MTEIAAKKRNKTEKQIQRKTRIKEKLKRIRIFVAILSSLLFVICLYSIYQSFTTESSEVTLSDIKWRFSTIIKLLISLLGYIGAILGNKPLLIVTTALVLIDILLAIGMYSHSYGNRMFHLNLIKVLQNYDLFSVESQYKQYLQYLGTINRSEDPDESDCDFIKVFRQTIIENIILISFYVF